MAKNLSKYHWQPCASCGHRDKHSEVTGCLGMVSVGPDTWCECATYVAPVTPNAKERTRRTDPSTSLAAAESIDVDDLNARQAAVLAFLREHGPMTDHQLVSHYQEPKQSPSGLRSRRSELTRAGLVYDTGDRGYTDSGRTAIIWAALQ